MFLKLWELFWTTWSWHQNTFINLEFFTDDYNDFHLGLNVININNTAQFKFSLVSYMN